MRATAATWAPLRKFDSDTRALASLAVAASLKRGGYRSAKQYFNSALQHQQRHLRQQVEPAVRHAIRDAAWAIWRGLGPDKLQDAFAAFKRLCPRETWSLLTSRMLPIVLTYLQLLLGS